MKSVWEALGRAENPPGLMAIFAILLIFLPGGEEAYDKGEQGVQQRRDA